MSFDDFMVDTITLQDETLRSATCDPVYGSPQYTACARVEDVNQLVLGQDGNEIRADHWIATRAAVTYATRIWLPGDNTADVSAARRALRVKRAREEDGSAGHYEVFL